MSLPLDIAIAGTRGVPARYSGFETFAEELGRRLVDRGHRVTVYGRVPYVGPRPRRHLGMRVVPIPAPRHKYLESPAHTLLSAFAALRERHDVVLVCSGANSFALPLFRLGGARVAINVDGIDRLRRKWGPLGRLWLRVGEPMALLFADRAIADADFLACYYRERYGGRVECIAYGGDRPPPQSDAVLARLGLVAGEYVLQVGRLVPENNALLVVRAFARVRTDIKLVVLGDSPYCTDYKRAVHAAAGPRVLLPGGVYGDDYLALLRGAACFVAAGEVGGTHPSLVEAMTHGPAVVAHDVPEHREVLGDAALYYASGDEAGLAACIERVLGAPALAERLREAARARARERYRWEQVVERYEALFADMCREARP